MPNPLLSTLGILDEETSQETVYDLKDAQARSDINTINGKIPSAASSSNQLVDNSAMNTAIATAVSSAYKHAGTKTVDELTSALLVSANKGNVYNMTDSGYTTADFLEGAGKPIDIGDNVGICEPTSGTFKFDLLSGLEDTSSLQPKTLDTPITVDGTQKTTVETALQAINTLAANVKSAVGTLSSLTTTVKTNIVAAINELVTSISTINGKIPSGASSSNKMATASDVASRVDWSSYAKTGVHNLARYNDMVTSNSGQYEITSTGLRVYNTNATIYSQAGMRLSNLPANTDIRVKTSVTVTSGTGKIEAYGSSNGGSSWSQLSGQTSDISTSGNADFTFNTGAYTYFRILFYSSRGTSASGNITYDNLIIFLNADSVTNYTEPAMTNKELTEALNVKKDTTQISSTNMTISQCAIAKAGQIRVCTIVAQANSDISASTIIMNDFPDKVSINYDATMNIVANTSAGVEYKLLSFTSGGVLGIKTMIAIPTGTSIRFTFTYIAE